MTLSIARQQSLPLERETAAEADCLSSTAVAPSAVCGRTSMGRRYFSSLRKQCSAEAGEPGASSLSWYVLGWQLTKDTCVKSSGFVSFLRVFRHSFFPRLMDVVIQGNAMLIRQF